MVAYIKILIPRTLIHIDTINKLNHHTPMSLHAKYNCIFITDSAEDYFIFPPIAAYFKHWTP
jgi:hypothetical protein